MSSTLVPESQAPRLFDESNLAVVYCGEETEYRRKKGGLFLIEQLVLSVTSLRQNWSATVPVCFMHTGPLATSTLDALDHLGVESQRHERFDERYPISNKMLVGYYKGSRHVLFMDCDTIVHRPVRIPNPARAALLVAPDVMPSLDEATFRDVFDRIGAPALKGKFVHSPALAYYAHDRTDLFPNWNAGVYVVERGTLDKLLVSYLHYLGKLIEAFGDKEWAFFIDQLCFTAAALTVASPIAFLPKGVNFICTPRSDVLSWWPKSAVVVEHYAGDTSSPSLNFSDLSWPRR